MKGEIAGGSLRLRPSSDDGAWDSLVMKHADATAFHLSAFLRTVAPLLGLRAHLCIAEADGEAVGVVPMLCRSIGPLTLVNHDLPFPYLGPLLLSDHSADAVLTAARRFLRPRTVTAFRIQGISPFPQPVLPGWERSEAWSAAIVPTAGKDDDELLGLLSRQQRGKVRRAVDLGLVPGPATRAEVDQLTAWVGGTFSRQGLPPRWPAGAHLSVYDSLAPTGACTATAVRQNGTLLAVSLDVVLGDLMIGWEMGMSEEGRQAGASLVLHTANMRHARDHGVREFDMLGAPTPGIAHYKRSLGAELRRRGHAQWEPGWLPPRRYLRRFATLLPAGRATSTA